MNKLSTMSFADNSSKVIESRELEGFNINKKMGINIKKLNTDLID